ncbi:MAG: ADP-ribosylglycohydrolase family protein [Cystobacterineae bacterium]|nr:ADP-ribosylglycohydrolase family protein [Cystobacterineae bacterium]
MPALATPQDRFRGCLLGFAIGDALGFALRGLPPNALRRAACLADDFSPRPRGRFEKGQFSDDTQLLLATVEAVLSQGRLDGKAAMTQYSWLWRDGIILHPPLNLSHSIQSFLSGTPWMSSGASLGLCEPSCLSRGAVIGLWEEQAPGVVAHRATMLTVPTHKDPMCAAACAAFARAIQLCLGEEPQTPLAFCQALAYAASASSPQLADELCFLPRALAWDSERALGLLRTVLVPSKQCQEEPGIPEHVAPVLLIALFAMMCSPDDLRHALNRVLRMGGAADVSAGMLGALFGASLGVGGFAPRLRKNIRYGEHILGAADRLFLSHQQNGPTLSEAMPTAAPHPHTLQQRYPRR